MRTLPLVALALIFTITAGFAQEMAAPCTAEKHMHSGMKHGLEMLDLTAEQTEEIDAIKMETEKGVIPVKSDIELKRLDLEKEMKLETPDRDGVMTLVKDIHALELKIKQARVDQHLKIHGVLTPEQRAEMSKQMHKGMKFDVMEGCCEHRVKIIKKYCGGCKGEGEVHTPCEKHEKE
ncbi:Spy/CpxP family protein refolding chaperone [candidate division WOR-3 bacterium]|nr:Spy/CpxP family protein refolding chaperone [candidate division WOR-3 bacterium]